jgi:hypothetical protein
LLLLLLFFPLFSFSFSFSFFSFFFSFCSATLAGSKKSFLFAGVTDLEYTHALSDLWELYLDGDGQAYWAVVESPDSGVPRFYMTVVMQSRNSTGLILYSGRTTLQFVSDNELARIHLGCNPGTYSPDFFSIPCQPCEEGTFASSASLSGACPGICPFQTTTQGKGLWTSAANCTVCQPS